MATAHVEKWRDLRQEMDPAPRHDSGRVLADGFSTEVDTVDKEKWDQICGDFSDANLYQHWSYATMRSGQSNITHLLLKQKNSVIAAVQGRIARIPFLKFGMVYVLWGPLWKRRDTAMNIEVFRQAIRAIRAEYVDRRRLAVRIVPNLRDADGEPFRRILEEEAYGFQDRVKRRRTILMDIRPSVEQLYKGLHQKWRNRLNNARKQNLKLIEGEGDSLFEAFRENLPRDDGSETVYRLRRALSVPCTPKTFNA